MSSVNCSICDYSMNHANELMEAISAKGKEIFFPKDSPFVRNATASFMGSVATILSLNPLFVLKVRIQNLDLQSVKLSTVANEISIVQKQRGIGGFWTGTSTALMMSLPNTVVYMTAYEKCKETLIEMQFKDKHVPTYVSGVAGAVARMISVSVVSPFELIRTIQSSGNNNSVLQIAKDVVKANGITGLYRGWVPTLWRDCPFSAIYWYSFESLRSPFQELASKYYYSDKPNSKDGFSPTVTMIAGSTAGTIAAIVTHPFDVVKTKQQLSDGSSKLVVDVLSLIRSGNANMLTRGLGIRLLTVIPACGIVITVYEGLRHIQ